MVAQAVVVVVSRRIQQDMVPSSSAEGVAKAVPDFPRAQFDANLCR